MCQETRLSTVPRSGKGSPELEASDRGKQSTCQETRLSAAPIVRCGRNELAIAVPERNTQGVLNLAKEAFATRRQLEQR